MVGLSIAAKKKGVVGGGSSLSEEEKEVIDLPRVEAAMQAAITALKWEYSNTLVTRLTPGKYTQMKVKMETLVVLLLKNLRLIYILLQLRWTSFMLT